MPLDLRPDYLAIVQEILRRHVPDREVWAFGSRVRGTARDASDLDLCIRGDESMGFERLGRLRDAFSASVLPFRVDVVDWATTAETFRGIIEKGRVVVKQDKMTGNLLSGTTAPRGLPVGLVHWPLVLARDLFELKYGKSLIATTRRPGNVPVFGTNGQCGIHDLALFKGPGVIIGRKGQGPLGVEWSTGDYWVIDTAYTLIPLRPDIDLKYSYFLIKYIGLNHLKDGTSNPTLSRDAFGAQVLPVPPLEQQRAIARILGALDDKIELNRRMNADLDAMVRAVFKDWFVDFGPVRAKADGRPAYLAPDIWEIFPGALDDEDKPVGWHWGTLSDVAELNPETWGSQNAPNYVSYVDLSNTKWGYIDKIEVYDWASAPSRARRILRSGDTIVGTVRPGNGSFAFIAEGGLTGSTGFAVLRPKTMQDRELVWCVATSTDNIERLSHLSDGGAYPAVRPEIVVATEIVIGDQPVRHAFSASCAPLLDQIEANKQESRSLSQLRDLLLPKLIIGEIRVRDAEKAVEEVL